VSSASRVGWLAVILVPFGVLAVGCAAPEPKAPPPVIEKLEEPEVEAEDLQGEVEMPTLPRNASCHQARAAYHDAWALIGMQKADLTNGQYGSVLGRNRYFDSCKVPSRYEIKICAAVQNGEVQGATVRTSPRAPHYERCIDRGVRRLDFPSHGRMDVTTTVFASGG
jgi:hypothetical protein